MNRPKPIVGQTLYSLNVGNAARGTPQVLTEVKVLKVGRTYFHAGVPDQHWTLYRYRLNDWVHDQGDGYSGYSRLYLTRQEWEDEKEASDLTRKIRSIFDTWTGRTDLSLPVLRQIADLVNQGTLWKSPETITLFPELHSDALLIKPLLIVTERDEWPQIGWWYAGLLNEWRQSGSPSVPHMVCWMPMPAKPSDSSRSATKRA